MNFLASITADPAMAFLQPGLDGQSVSPTFSRALQRNVTVVALRALRHKPGRRCLIEYQLVNGEMLIGKVRAKATPTAVFDILTRLWNSGFNDAAPDGIHVAQPLAVIPELRMILLRKEHGRLAADILPGSDGMAVARRLADVAHKLHTSPVMPTKTHTVGDELNLLDQRLTQASQIHPQWGRRIDAVRAGCHQLASTLRISTPVPVHRDFHPGQVLVEVNQYCLLDLDLFSIGDPALDIGNFIAHLSELGLREHDRVEFFSDREEALVNRYVELNSAISREAIQVYKSLTLARHIFISTQFPDRRKATERLLSWCERKLY
jgi:hypothetical protein